jgi:hypothetical protein
VFQAKPAHYRPATVQQNTLELPELSQAVLSAAMYRTGAPHQKAGMPQMQIQTFRHNSAAGGTRYHLPNAQHKSQPAIEHSESKHELVRSSLPVPLSTGFILCDLFIAYFA